MRKVLISLSLFVIVTTGCCGIILPNPAKVNQKNVYLLTKELAEYRDKDPKYIKFKEKNKREHPGKTTKELRDKKIKELADEIVKSSKRGSE